MNLQGFLEIFIRYHRIVERNYTCSRALVCDGVAGMCARVGAYACKVTKEDKEIASLIESGFPYVCENDGAKFFRKPK